MFAFEQLIIERPLIHLEMEKIVGLEQRALLWFYQLGSGLVPTQHSLLSIMD